MTDRSLPLPVDEWVSLSVADSRLYNNTLFTTCTHSFLTRDTDRVVIVHTMSYVHNRGEHSVLCGPIQVAGPDPEIAHSEGQAIKIM